MDTVAERVSIPLRVDSKLAVRFLSRVPDERIHEHPGATARQPGDCHRLACYTRYAPSAVAFFTAVPPSTGHARVRDFHTVHR